MMRWRWPARPRGRRSRHRAARLLGIAGLVLVALTACEDGSAPPADDDTSEQAPPDRPAEADGGAGAKAPGVSSDPCPDAVDEELGCLRLGSLVDRGDAPADEHADELLAGQRDFWHRVNESGGVAGHEVRVAGHVRDVTDDADEQVAAAEELLDEVLAFALLPGDVTTVDLVETLDGHGAVGVLPGWWSGWHVEEHRDTLLLPADHSRCLAVTMGLDWYAEEVGQPLAVQGIAPEGRVADDVAGGAEAWAEALDARWLGVTGSGAGDEDDRQDAAVQAVLEASPDVVVVGTGPAETGELVRKAAARGFQGTFLGLVDSWDPALLDAPEQAQALQALYRHVGPWGEMLPREGAHAAMRRARDDQPLSPGYLTGWLSSYPLLAALRTGAEQDELTREGLRGALADLRVDYEDALPEGGSTVRALVSTPDAQAAWGLHGQVVTEGGPGTAQLDHPADCEPS